jgi:hypothetical protein
MFSFLLTFPPKTYMHLSSPQLALHALPISCSSTWPSKSTSSEAPRYVVSSNLLSPHLSFGAISDVYSYMSTRVGVKGTAVDVSESPVHTEARMAPSLTRQVHETGCSSISWGPREQCERKMWRAGIWTALLWQHPHTRYQTNHKNSLPQTPVWIAANTLPRGTIFLNSAQLLYISFPTSSNLLRLEVRIARAQKKWHS